MILYDSEMTTQMRLAYEVYLSSVGSANSLVLRCPLRERSVRALRRTPGASNPGGRGLKNSQCSAVSFSKTLLLGPFRFGFLWNAAAEFGWCDLCRAGTSSSWVQCNKLSYRRLRRGPGSLDQECPWLGVHSRGRMETPENLVCISGMHPCRGNKQHFQT